MVNQINTTKSMYFEENLQRAVGHAQHNIPHGCGIVFYICSTGCTTVLSMNNGLYEAKADNFIDAIDKLVAIANKNNPNNPTAGQVA